MPNIDTVLFDLDGTLIDSIQLIIDSYHHALAANGLPARTDQEWLDGIGTPLSAQFAPWGHEPGRIEALIATYREYNLANHDARVRPYPGVVDMVLAIKSAGRKTGLVTSKNRNGAFRGLTVCRLESVMDVVVGSDEVTNAKPHPEPVQKAVALLGADPATTIYVGDSIHDMQSGRAAGVQTAAVLWGPFRREQLALTEPDYWLDTPSDLLKLISDDDLTAGTTDSIDG